MAEILNKPNLTIQEAIEYLNDKIHGENAEHVNNLNHNFYYTDCGFAQSISLAINDEYFNVDINLWNSENDDREFIEAKNDYEPLEHFIIKRYNRFVGIVTELGKNF